MARSKFVWLIVFENGKTQFVKAQTVNQILYCNQLSENVGSIIDITRMDLDNNWSYVEAVDIPFED